MAVALGVSQVTLETEYYMVDLPKVVAEKRKQEAARLMQDVHMRLATNGRSLEEADYKTFVRDVSKALGVKQETTFNREKFEQLRAMTNGR